MTINEKFGKIIRLLREEQNISQEKFALMIGMDRSYYATIETGKHSITLNKIESIAKGLNIPISKMIILMEKIEEN